VVTGIEDQGSLTSCGVPIDREAPAGFFRIHLLAD
jgi:hypothetical protein